MKQSKRERKRADARATKEYFERNKKKHATEAMLNAELDAALESLRKQAEAMATIRGAMDSLTKEPEPEPYTSAWGGHEVVEIFESTDPAFPIGSKVFIQGEDAVAETLAVIVGGPLHGETTPVDGDTVDLEIRKRVALNTGGEATVEETILRHHLRTQFTPYPEPVWKRHERTIKQKLAHQHPRGVVRRCVERASIEVIEYFYFHTSWDQAEAKRLRHKKEIAAVYADTGGIQRIELTMPAFDLLLEHQPPPQAERLPARFFGTLPGLPRAELIQVQTEYVHCPPLHRWAQYAQVSEDPPRFYTIDEFRAALEVVNGAPMLRDIKAGERLGRLGYGGNGCQRTSSK